MPLGFPSITPSASSWEIISNARQFVSPLTGAIQTAQRGGTRWLASLTFNNLTGADRAVMQAFLAQLQGTANNFYLTDHSYTRRADGAGTPRVNGASQTGNQLVTDGWTSGTYAFLRGDLFTVNGELKMAVADATITAGAATVDFVPELREAPADNATLTISAPTGIFRLVSPSSGWTNQPGVFSTFTVEAIEDVIA
jgi:hypothetical protein